ncbi:hypothetical protein ACF09G_03830 [Streptomyces albogriseolus]|uniref:PknH-like extracellular domain-containing protein n=2 Tax=unclassified Streptomyces TaxID=2593676 RepID=V9Z4C7_9ACTN|nr:MULTISPECIES: hypothetical protein [unclassified Streptomyces]AHE38898.1 hypothetical protein pFRL3_121 [Streptomyces sp. FR1]AHE39382.1 hypothetical protein pFRL4_149 [Streptomyces sp. F2]
MSDEHRRPPQDELGALLHGFADEAEPLISIGGGVTDVHERVRRHRTRRRLTVTTAGCAALLSVGLWSLPSLLGGASADRPEQTSPGLVSAASILPAPDSGGGLPRTDLLSPSALPWNAGYRWHTTTTGNGATTPLPTGGTGECALRWFDGTGAEDQIARAYSGDSGTTAQHRIVAYADNSSAQHAIGQLADALHRCGWHETRSPDTQDHDATAPALYEYVLTNGAEDPLRVTLVQSDHRVAVLVLATPQVADHAHADPRTEHCLEQTVNSAQPHTPSPSSTGHC